MIAGFLARRDTSIGMTFSDGGCGRRCWLASKPGAKRPQPFGLLKPLGGWLCLVRAGTCAASDRHGWSSDYGRGTEALAPCPLRPMEFPAAAVSHVSYGLASGRTAT